jgi:hypothetical protein
LKEAPTYYPFDVETYISLPKNQQNRSDHETLSNDIAIKPITGMLTSAELVNGYNQGSFSPMMVRKSQCF